MSMETRSFEPERDTQFVFALFCELRAAELRAACGSEAALLQLLALQHQAQLASYRRSYPQAERAVFVCDGQAIGYWLLDRGAEAFSLIDFALAAAFRGRGFGRSLLHGLQQRARAEGLSIRLHVRPENPAQHLYRRLGFVITECSPIELAMEWRAHA